MRGQGVSSCFLTLLLSTWLGQCWVCQEKAASLGNQCNEKVTLQSQSLLGCWSWGGVRRCLWPLSHSGLVLEPTPALPPETERL